VEGFLDANSSVVVAIEVSCSAKQQAFLIKCILNHTNTMVYIWYAV